MTIEQKYEKIVEEAKKTRKSIKQLQKDTGTYETPVDIDMVKTAKAMFYEKVIEILKQK